MRAKYGYLGKMLFVNLSEGKIQEEDLSEDLARGFIGGYGIGARVIYERMKPGADPLGPDNIFALGTGPLTLTGTVSTCRITAMGKSPLTGKVGLEINPQDTPVGICTSSGTVGHSLSLGKADAAVVLARSAALADAAATAIGNIILQPDDINKGIELAQEIGGLRGLVIIKDDDIGIWGDIKICPTAA